jgi:hypothetical protein
MAESATAESDSRPLTAEEQATLDRLLVRASAGKGPSARIGDAYEALACLSVPRRGDSKDRGTDLALPGDTVYLTPEEAAKFQRNGPRDGRRVPVIRKLSGPDGSREPLPRLLPRHLSGGMFQPQAPPPNTDLPRPDPEESSRVQYIQDGAAPESAGATPVDPAEMADVLRSGANQDAVDLPPRRARARG